MVLGGGAVLDAVGFAAAIFHRGVRHIRCPTTLLAQDDSGVGVKKAINAYEFKNLLSEGPERRKVDELIALMRRWAFRTSDRVG